MAGRRMPRTNRSDAGGIARSPAAACVAGLVLAVGVLALGARSADAAGGHPHFHDGGTLDWFHLLDAARARARAEHKFIFVEVGKPGCGNCRDLITRQVPAANVKERLARISIGLAIDSRNPDARVLRIFQRWVPAAQLQKLPWAGFLDEEGRWITGWGGRITDPRYEAFLTRAEQVHRVAEKKRRIGGTSTATSAGENEESDLLADLPFDVEHAAAVPPDPGHVDASGRAVSGERKTLLSTLDGIGSCIGGRCGVPSTPSCGPDGCDAPATALADLPGSDAPFDLEGLIAESGPIDEPGLSAADDAPYVPPPPFPSMSGGPAPAPRTFGSATEADSLPPPLVVRRDAAARPTPPRPSPREPGGDKPIVDGRANAESEVRTVRTRPEPVIDPLAPWGEARVIEAYASAAGGDLDDARVTLEAVVARMPSHAITEDARRGLDALKDLGEIRQMRETSPIRAHLLARARDVYRGSRWSALFR